MRSFYFRLWSAWLVRVVVYTLVFAALLSGAITLFIYIKQGMLPLNEEVEAALYAIWHFWFLVSVNITLLFALFGSIKYLFNHCYAGYMLRLKVCDKAENTEYIEVVAYGDLIKVWRKWFMLLIWLVAAFMILSVVFTYLFSSYESLFEWFSIYLLYVFIAIAAYFSFILLSARCRAIKVVKC